jgi:DNA transformation protein and related proteins
MTKSDPLRIRDLPGLGPKSEAQLAEIGIESVEALRQLGPARAWLALKFRFGRTISRNFLHALEAGIRGVDWRSLTPVRKAELEAEVSRTEDALRGRGGSSD